jgi:hypothetical protein
VSLFFVLIYNFYAIGEDEEVADDLDRVAESLEFLKCGICWG